MHIRTTRAPFPTQLSRPILKPFQCVLLKLHLDAIFNSIVDTGCVSKKNEASLA
jgi:hypothetical protein